MLVPFFSDASSKRCWPTGHASFSRSTHAWPPVRLVVVRVTRYDRLYAVLCLVRLELASFDVARVLLNVGVPLLGKVIQRKDRRNWADWYAGAAVDALDRGNEQLVNLLEPWAAVFVLGVLFRMDAVHWAGIHTGRILSPD